MTTARRSLALGLALAFGVATLTGCGGTPAPTETPKVETKEPDAKAPAKKNRALKP